jgi:hypothetical protein
MIRYTNRELALMISASSAAIATFTADFGESAGGISKTAMDFVSFPSR